MGTGLYIDGKIVCGVAEFVQTPTENAIVNDALIVEYFLDKNGTKGTKLSGLSSAAIVILYIH